MAIPFEGCFWREQGIRAIERVEVAKYFMKVLD